MEPCPVCHDDYNVWSFPIGAPELRSIIPCPACQNQNGENMPHWLTRYDPDTESLDTETGEDLH